jgi:dynein heavy chain
MSGEDLNIRDPRVEFLAVYVIKSMKLKAEKWTKMFNVEEHEKMICEFVEKKDVSDILTFHYSGSLSQSISASTTGALTPSFSYPPNIKNKVVYFIKKEKGTMLQMGSNTKEALYYGDICYSAMGQLSAAIDELIIPVFSNKMNQMDWPKVISSDLMKHVNNLKNRTYVLQGLLKGKTQLPIPAGAERVSDREIKKAEK